MSWFDIFKEGKYMVWVIGTSNSRIVEWTDLLVENTEESRLFSSRQEAFVWLKEDFWRQGNNPGNTWPWTLEGTVYQGRAVCYDNGVALVLSAPAYKYAITREGEDPPPKDEINVDWTSPDRMIDRLEGRQYDPERDEHPEDWKEDNQ